MNDADDAIKRFKVEYLPPNPDDVPPSPKSLANDREVMLDQVLRMIEDEHRPRDGVIKILKRWQAKGWQR